MSDAARLLMKTAEKLRKEAEDINDRKLLQLERENKERMSTYYNLIRSAPEVCNHDGGTYNKEHRDYHHNEERTDTHCSICNKLIK